MSLLKLKSIKLRNFGTIYDSELVFPQSGVVLVIGTNSADSNGKFQSIGSGKTLLGEALSRTLVGIDGRFSNFGHYSSDAKGNKDTYIRVEAEFNGKPLVVESGFKCHEISRSGEGFKFSYDNGPAIQRAHLKDTREELEKTLKISPELAEWTVFIDGDKLRFNRLSEKKSVELLMLALSQPNWTQYHENSNKILTGFKRQVDAASYAHSAAKSSLGSAESSVENGKRGLAEQEKIYQKAVNEAEKQTEAIQVKIDAALKSEAGFKAEKVEIKKQMKELEDSGAEELKKLELERLNLKSKVNEIQTERNSLSESKAAARSLLTAGKGIIDEMKAVPKTCPTCNKPWDKKHGEEEFQKQQDIVDKRKLALSKIEEKIIACDERLNAKKDEYEDVEERIRGQDVKPKIQKKARRYEECDRLIEETRTEHFRLERSIESSRRGPNKSEIERLQAVVKERESQVTKIKDEIVEHSHALAEAEEAVKVIQYWTEAFSPTGIPNMILQDTIAPLNDISRRLSTMMTGGTIGISYSTRRELASGRERAELVINIKNLLGSKRVEGSSKGEGGLTNLIIAETLAEVGSMGSRIGYQWMDEVTNGQDPVVRRNVFNYLREKAASKGILIFVVDHSAEAASYADHVLVATKTLATGTTFHWQS